MKFVLIVDILDILRSTAIVNTYKNGDCFNNIYRWKRWLDNLSTSLLDRYWTRRLELFLCYAPRSDSLDRNGTILLAYSYQLNWLPHQILALSTSQTFPSYQASFGFVNQKDLWDYNAKFNSEKFFCS